MRKNCLVGAVKVTRNLIKRTFIYNEYEIAFDGLVLKSFSDGFTWNVFWNNLVQIISC